MAAEEADVIVIGGGPVGLTLATELSYRGISTILIEKNHTTAVLAKAVAISSRSMEHYRRHGLEERIHESSFPRDHPFGLYVGTSALGGRTIWQRSFSSAGEDFKFPFYQAGASVVTPLFCAQPKLEPILKEHLETSADSVKMFWGWLASALTQDEERVTVKVVQTVSPTSPAPQEVATAEEPQEKVFKAKYLVACDGGSSWARKQLGIHTYGRFRMVRAVSVTIKSPKAFARMKEEGRTGFSVILKEKFTAVLVMMDGEGNFAIHITSPPDTPDKDIQNIVENISQCFASIIGANLPHTVVGVSAYSMHALVSTKYREGRCFLAGDSAHQWLPAGGLGMNVGVSDAANLAWKLEAVLKGYGGPHLLDSYETERRVLADVTRRFSITYGAGLGFSPTMMRVRALAISNPITRLFLSIAMRKMLQPQYTTGNSIVLGFQYSNSGVVVHELDPTGNIKLSPSSQARGKYVPSSLPGCRAPHVALPDCASTIDLFGKKFVLLVVGGEETDLELLKLELKECGVPFDTYAYPKLPELVDCYDRKYFLVRPDGVVAWRSDYQPSALESKKVVRTVTGDVILKRIPSPPVRSFHQPSHPSGVDVFHGVVAAASTLLLQEYTNLPGKYTIAVGLGVFWLLRALRSTRPPQFLQLLSRHRAVIQDRFGEADDVLQVEPQFTGNFRPKDVLVRVRAASLNPLDIAMRRGYGAPLLSKLASPNRKSYFPLVLGRDCSGEVVAVGDEVTKFLPGDQVFGVASLTRQGTHAQYVTLGENELCFKPSNVDHREAASLPWVATATWTALVKHGGLTPENTRGKKVLVHAGSGGVGSFAIQLLKAWGAEVATTCSTQNIGLAHHLGADKVIDYTSGDFTSVLSDYDLVFNTVIGYENRSLNVLKCFGNATYVSIIVPKLFLITKFGGFFGQLAFSWLYRLKVLVNRLFYGRAFYYSIAEPSPEALEAVLKMVERGEVRPLIDAVYTMDEIVAAHKHVEDKHTRGKVIITMD